MRMTKNEAAMSDVVGRSSWDRVVRARTGLMELKGVRLSRYCRVREQSCVRSWCSVRVLASHSHSPIVFPDGRLTWHGHTHHRSVRIMPQLVLGQCLFLLVALYSIASR